MVSILHLMYTHWPPPLLLEISYFRLLTFIFCTGYQSRNWILVSRRKNNVYREGTIDWLALPTIVHKVTLKYKNLNYSSTSIPNSITPFLPPITRSFYPSFPCFFSPQLLLTSSPHLPLFSHRSPTNKHLAEWSGILLAYSVPGCRLLI